MPYSSVPLANGCTPREQYLAQFKAYTDRMMEITTAKNNDYGGEVDPFKNFREFGELGFLVRMSDKWARIKSALWEKRELQVKDESVEDTLLDLANYCILLLCWRKAESPQARANLRFFGPGVSDGDC